MASEDSTATPSSTKSKIPYSHSSPTAIDGASNGGDSSEAKLRAGKLLAVNVCMLDESCVTMHVQPKALGRVLFELVCKHLNLLEVDYFGLEYGESNDNKYWLDCDKPMNKQLDLNLTNCKMNFGVKFYTPDPSQLEEEYTRYLFCLQIKKDLSTGWLQCNDNTAALMASYIVQADCGDFVAEDYPDHTYLSTYKFFPHQDEELEKKIMENHKKHVGQTPATADLNLLETARRCELYGIRMHPAKDQAGVSLNLAIAHMGVLVFQNYTKINTFSWAKIRKLSFKRKRFLIKLHPEGYGFIKDLVEFLFEGRNECKNFWKKCVEHHGFFRCSSVKKTPRQKARVLSRGSSFRYSGRTQKQVVDYVRDNYVKRQPFQRSQSFRHSSSAHSSIGKVGSSKSAQPLLPVGDQTVGTPASQSCGSMVLNDSASTEAPASPCSDRISGVIRTSPELHSDWQRQTSPEGTRVTTHQNEEPSVVNGGITTKSVEAEPLRKEVTCDSSPPKVACLPQEVPSSPITSNNNNKVICPVAPSVPTKEYSEEPEVDMRKKRYPTDKAYYVAKEILTTERTYKKDLEVLNRWLREEISNENYIPTALLNHLFSLIDPIYEFHSSFLRDIEQRLATWEGRSNAHLKGDYQRIGDILLNNMTMLDMYKTYLDNYMSILEQLDHYYHSNKRFEQFYKEFEVQKVCYLPLNCFVLKPVHRLIHYKLLLEKLVLNYGINHPDAADCKMALNRLKEVTIKMASDVKKAENYVKLVELQRDLVGLDDFGLVGKEFIREGCLQKLSKKGFQQRMFFLFSDVLLYANRTSSSSLQFKVHGQVPLRGIEVENYEPRHSAPHCFAIYSQNKPLIVAASSQEEKDKWVEDLRNASQRLKERKLDKFPVSSLKSCSSSDEVLDKLELPGEEEVQSPSRPTYKTAQQRSNTTVHVCWHRNTSVSMKDHDRAVENQLSGYLLRKFKNSNGWQKLWVVFTNFCLFFYKTFQDDFPLASLPLLGYTITVPTESDNINKDYVFKLQFKNHVYFFRAESEYSYGRWMEVICCATQHSGRLRLFSRTESLSES